jgi:glycosyltransferase involved in cell wall biosynthesis
MSPTVAFVSFRFGATDGVSVVARTWMDAVAAMGADVVTVTGTPTEATPYPSRVVAGLGLDHDLRADEIEPALREALADVDVAVVENLLTIPMNLRASAATARALSRRPALIHHHDPPWHRERFAHVTELPATDPAWRHVAITELLAGELAQRGIEATAIHNAFPEPPARSEHERAERRAAVRAEVGLGPDELVVAHPVRAIERKNLPAAINLAEALGATYWLLGPAEEGYGDELDRLLGAARCRVVHHPWPDAEGIYLAADHITFPSTWEGFGNPPLEAALHRRTVSVGDYPVAAELRRFGFDWFSPGEVDAIREALDHPDAPAAAARLDRNQRIARESFSLEHMAARLAEVFDAAGWWP